MENKKNKGKTSSEEKSLRMQRIIFIAFSIIIVLTMVLGLMSRY
jgi:hypothetical protein